MARPRSRAWTRPQLGSTRCIPATCTTRRSPECLATYGILCNCDPLSSALACRATRRRLLPQSQPKLALPRPPSSRGRANLGWTIHDDTRLRAAHGSGERRRTPCGAAGRSTIDGLPRAEKAGSPTANGFPTQSGRTARLHVPESRLIGNGASSGAAVGASVRYGVPYAGPRSTNCNAQTPPLSAPRLYAAELHPFRKVARRLGDAMEEPLTGIARDLAQTQSCSVLEGNQSCRVLRKSRNDGSWQCLEVALEAMLPKRAAECLMRFCMQTNLMAFLGSGGFGLFGRQSRFAQAGTAVQ